MNGVQPLWQMILPVVVIGIVFALRIKRMKRGRPFSPVRVAIGAVLLIGVIGFVFATQPPTALGWGCFAAGIGLGALLGVARAHVMRVERDQETGQVLIHQTPAALFMLAALVIAKRVIGPTTPGTAGGHTISLLTDGLLGLAFGLLMATQLWLWQRVRKAA